MTRTPTKGSKQYFTKDHENAILEYCTILDLTRKNVIYRDYIQPVFNEMVEKIVFTYKFNTLPNIEDLKDECKIWLVTILDKFSPSKGSKAFSYFSVITKNWFIHKVKKNNTKREIYLEDYSGDDQEISTDDSYLTLKESEEFWEAFEKQLDNWSLRKMKENEEKVYKAIVILFKDSANIQIFNKKAIYLYVREITGLNTKQIVCNLKKFRIRYQSFKEDWYNGNI